jgi:WD40 repeat protein
LRITTISAHNYVEVWDILETPALIKRKFCDEECILYSADYKEETQLVAAGTVFRSVLIWDIENQGLERSKVLLKLQGHAGVIFDVKFLDCDLFASVSDDRSLRLWKLLGLGTDSPSYQQLGEYYGHRSRIWKVRELGW